MKSVKLFFFLPFFLFFSLPPAFSADHIAHPASSDIVQKSSLPEWVQFVKPQNHEVSIDVEEESSDGDSPEDFYTFPRHSLSKIINQPFFLNQNRFPWNPFQSYYSRLTNSPPSFDLA